MKIKTPVQKYADSLTTKFPEFENFFHEEEVFSSPLWRESELGKKTASKFIAPFSNNNVIDEAAFDLTQDSLRMANSRCKGTS